MKVKDFLKKYRMCSNTDVFLQSTSSGEFTKLDKQSILHLEPEALMTETLKSFDIIDNVLTIYIP